MRRVCHFFFSPQFVFLSLALSLLTFFDFSELCSGTLGCVSSTHTAYSTAEKCSIATEIIYRTHRTLPYAASYFVKFILEASIVLSNLITHLTCMWKYLFTHTRDTSPASSLCGSNHRLKWAKVSITQASAHTHTHRTDKRAESEAASGSKLKLCQKWNVEHFQIFVYIYLYMLYIFALFMFGTSTWIYMFMYVCVCFACFFGRCLPLPQRLAGFQLPF